jgi:protein O-GlcNAc transferase
VSETADELMRRAFPLQQAGDVAAAEGLYERILTIDPGYADAHYLLGTLARERGDLEDAVRRFRRAIAANAKEATFHAALAQVFYAQASWPGAIACFTRAVELRPDVPEWWNDLGCAHQELGEPAEALRCFERALAIAPEFPPALNNGGNTLRDLGRVEEALQWLGRLRALLPGAHDLASNYLFTLNLSTSHTAAEIAAEHRAFGARFAAPRRWPPRRAGGRLRVAYFSPDLRAHPVTAFLEPVLRHHDRSRFEVSAFHLHPVEDAVSERLRGLCDRWLNAAALSDDELAAAIEAAGVDVLVDLAGHTSHNRLPVLARKPAPVIATWLGYLNSTGLEAVDFRITDAACDPPGSEARSRETLVRLPHAHLCFMPPDLPCEPGPLPALSRGAVRFASFNKSSKLNAGTLALWARILARVPGATLLVVGVEPAQQARIGAELAGHGVAPGRVEFAGRTPLAALLERHREVDIALDSHPYSGTTTTFNSLWMGVPVVTLMGETPVSRSAGGVLATLGLEDCVATTPDEYVERAVARAADLEALARLRAGMRARLRASPLMDGPGFTRALEKTYLDLWQRKNP